MLQICWQRQSQLTSSSIAWTCSVFLSVEEGSYPTYYSRWRQLWIFLLMGKIIRKGGDLLECLNSPRTKLGAQKMCKEKYTEKFEWDLNANIVYGTWAPMHWMNMSQTWILLCTFPYIYFFVSLVFSIHDSINLVSLFQR